MSHGRGPETLCRRGFAPAETTVTSTTSRAATWRRYTRHAVVVIFIAAGVLTPDPSVVSQLLVGAPITGLYSLGMLAAAWGERTRTRVARSALAA